MSAKEKKVKEKAIPPAPPTNPLMGEYTPEYLGWVKKYHPEVFKKKYKEKVVKFKYKVVEPK